MEIEWISRKNLKCRYFGKISSSPRYNLRLDSELWCHWIVVHFFLEYQEHQKLQLATWSKGLWEG